MAKTSAISNKNLFVSCSINTCIKIKIVEFERISLSVLYISISADCEFDSQVGILILSY